jgi:hypothetical protein
VSIGPGEDPPPGRPFPFVRSLTILLALVMVSNIGQHSAEVWLCRKPGHSGLTAELCGRAADARQSNYQRTIDMILALLAGRGLRP